MKKLKDLPESQDEYWDPSEKVPSVNIPLYICETHGKKWKDHVGYADNHDGTARCKFCSWGFRVPGYMRIYKEKVYDLRSE